MRIGSPYPADNHPDPRPVCEECGTEMWLLSSDPHPELAAHDHRRYECPVCKIARLLVVDRWSGAPAGP